MSIEGPVGAHETRIGAGQSGRQHRIPASRDDQDSGVDPAGTRTLVAAHRDRACYSPHRRDGESIGELEGFRRPEAIHNVLGVREARP